MADQITKDGIEIETAQEIANNIINGTQNTLGLVDIFGNDTNFDQDSPDAQLVNIFAQCKRDLSELAVQIFNSFDPDQASGSVLDARVLYNGVIRKGGTYTQQGITIVVDRAITLKGIDNKTDDEINDSDVFTIQDYNGNQYYLMTTTSFAIGTTQSVPFRAQYMGETLSTLNSINEIVTPQRGVISVNNPTAPMKIGVAQETDEELKLRRAKAVGLGMLGSVEVLQASLRQIADVTDACVFENNTSFPSEGSAENSIPAHSVWIIVRGGNVQDIANCIYLRLNAGCGMKGSTSYPVQTVYGDSFDVYFDIAQKEELSIRLHVQPINGVDQIDPQVLADYIAYNYNFNIYEPATATRIDALCKAFNNNFSYSQIEISAANNSRGSIETTTEQNLAYWTSVVNGSLSVTLDGATDPVQVNGMNFSSIVSLVNVATIITKAFEAAGIEAYAEANSTKITLYSKTRGNGSSIAVNAISGSFDDLSGSNFLDAENMTYTTGVDATQGYITCNTMTPEQITALSAVTNGSFEITVNNGLNNAGNEVQVTGLDFSGVTSADDVATVVNNKLASMPNVLAYCYATNLNVFISSELYGANSSIAIGVGTSGTNVVTSGLLIDPLETPVQGTDGTNGTATTDGFTLANWTAEHNGALSIKVNGNNAQVLEWLDFSACDTITKVATYLNNKFAENGILATATAGGGELTITSNIAGNGSKIEFVPYTGAYTDISNADLLNRTTMSAQAGVSPGELTWETLLFPEYKKNYFEIDPSFISVTVDE